MKNMYERYGNHMILLDATYRTTKYALSLFFVVVQTNVNSQVCCVIVLRQESTEIQQKNQQKRKHPFSKRVGSVADMMVQFYRAKIVLADESEERKAVTNIEIDGDDQLFEGFYACSIFYVCFVMPFLRL